MVAPGVGGEGSAAGGAWDVVIIGGGPAGTTCATLLRKYNPALRVLILEKEVFPREHIGESQLPAIMPVLDEMGVWDKVEAADFPVKLGASFTWGRDEESWDFDFYPVAQFRDEPRPGRYEGQRQFTAFQVERSRYDKILLDHARSMGCEAREGTPVREILREGDRVTGLVLEGGQRIVGRHYVDASGAWGVLRRAMGIHSDAPKELRNIAIWNYWEKAEWAVKIGVGGTRIQVRSLPYGWIWFIPLGPTRTSVGLVCPAAYYKESGLSTQELYDRALRDQPQIAHLLRNAHPDDELRSIKDWSHLSDRLVGENWILVGEACGFADPILSAGMSLAHHSGRDAAYTILELERGTLDASWLRERYDEKNRTNIRQHIRFAQFWYASNGCFTELKDHCRKIADEAGLEMSPREAWEWLARGGFTAHTVGVARAGSFNVAGSKHLVEKFTGENVLFEIEKFNRFVLDLDRAERGHIGALSDGRINKVECFRRDGRLLPAAGDFSLVIAVLRVTSDGTEMVQRMSAAIATREQPANRMNRLLRVLQALEAMIHDGWVRCEVDQGRPMLTLPAEINAMIRRTDSSTAMGR